MDFIESEVLDIQKRCENLIQNTKIVACMKSLIRIELKQTLSRQLIICLRFPQEYPRQGILVELKSKTLSAKFLSGLTNLCEKRAGEFLNEHQALEVLKFIAGYLNDNPLCICFDEIACLKKTLKPEIGGELKLKQKSSTVTLLAKGGQYYFKIKVFISEDYPLSAVSWNQHESNLPTVLVRFLNGQAREIARQCVEPPLKYQAKSDEPFEPKPSLQKALQFLIEATVDFHLEKCPICKKSCLPLNPDNVITNDLHDDYVERVFCGHIYHQGCLKKYLQEPPFPSSGKLCMAPKRHPRSDQINGNCKKPHHSSIPNGHPQLSKKDNVDACAIRLSHDRWGLNIKAAEARWAQKQARERELEEVKDFLQ